MAAHETEKRSPKTVVKQARKMTKIKEYPKLRDACILRWTQDEEEVWLYDRDADKSYRLPVQAGILLSHLDGETDPELLPLEKSTVYHYLCQFERRGFLENTGGWTWSFGLLIWLVPCRELSRGKKASVLWRLYAGINLLWLPLLVLCVVAATNLDISRLTFDFSAAQINACAFCMFVLSISFHELAHAAAANRYRLPVTAFGGGFMFLLPCACTLIPELPYAPWKIQRAVARSGPLANVCLGCLLFTAWALLYKEVLFWGGVVNFLLAMVNLFPLPHADGHAFLMGFSASRRMLTGAFPKRAKTGRMERTVSLILRGAFILGVAAVLIWDLICWLDILRGLLLW